MNKVSLSVAVPQPEEHKPWAEPPVIPKDDAAVLTTLLPLLGLLVIYGAVLLSSVRSHGVDSPVAETLLSTRMP